MASRRTRWAGLAAAAALCLGAGPVRAQEVTHYLTLEEAPRAVFPEADGFERRDVPVDEAFRRALRERVGRARPSIWEPFYITFVAKKGDEVVGYAVVCEEIGKHRPITFIVAVRPDGTVHDVAIMTYREAIGDEVRYRSFLRQFEGKSLEDPIRPRRDIANIAGATLSVQALARGVRKALAVLELVYLEEEAKTP